jgi:general secretion pathway protein A
MYAQFFGLKHEPFSIAPDPRYLFMSERHREALAHLLYGVGGGGGFVLLSGEIGAGKTTVCRCFLEQIPRRCNVAYIFNPKLTVIELLKSVCEEFRIPYEHQGPSAATVKDYLDPLNEFLLKTHAVGQNNVLIIDEAQNLSPDVLEQLRLLTNLETSERKLLQIILIGQPELRSILAKPELEQLAQRVIARFHLGALTETETGQYIAHRLQVAGLKRGRLFSSQAVQRIHQLSRGIPRRINLLCDRALLGAYVEGKSKVDRTIVDKAASEVFDNPKLVVPKQAVPHHAVRWVAAIVTGAVLVGALGWGLLSWQSRSAGLAEVAASTTSASTAASAAAQSSSQAVALPVPSLPASVVDLSGELSKLAASPTGGHEKDAWRELALAWGLQLGDGDPCQAVLQLQLRCYKGGNTLATIRELDRPGILTLYTADGKPAFVLLTGLTSQSATLSIGGVLRSVPLADLARLWRGDFATYWRAPPGYVNKVVEGNSGPVVDWLATQLATLNGEPGPTTRQTYDAKLRAQVNAFQLAQGLKPDGQAGATTFMQLNRALGVDEPRLMAPQAGVATPPHAAH